MYESYILSDGAACLNQAYCSPWKAINLETGKPLLDDKFKNLHWPLPLPNDANDRIDRLVNGSDRLVESFEESSEWNPVMHVLDKFNTYSELENYVESLPKKTVETIEMCCF